MELADRAGIPVLIETHRDRMTPDLRFTLDLLDRRPDLPLLADLSHYLVGREFAWPVKAENHALIHRIMGNAWAFHGRIASREQIQVEISFLHHQPWLDLFLGRWDHPQLAITGGRGCGLGLHVQTGAETLCLQMKVLVQQLWAERSKLQSL